MPAKKLSFGLSDCGCWRITWVRRLRGNKLSGLRGVTYAERYAKNVSARGGAHTDGEFRLLVRQVPYGVLGIYAAVAEGCKLIDRKTYCVTRGLGEPLAKAFLSETQIPRRTARRVKRGDSPSPNES